MRKEACLLRTGIIAFCQAREGLNLARAAASIPKESLSAQRTSLK